MSKIWEDDTESSNQKDHPEVILSELANKLQVDTEGRFIGLVIETISEDTGEATYALCILVPRLRDYIYRLIEINIKNLTKTYPLEIRLFAQDPRKNESYNCQNSEQLKDKLQEFIKSSVTRSILAHLRGLIELKMKNNLSKIYMGNTGTVILKDGKRVMAGFKEVKGEDVIYYTGKGLREMFNPNPMTDDEKLTASKLRELSDDVLEKEGYIQRIKLIDIVDIE